MAQQYKGPRDAIYARPTIDVGLAVRREAAEHGMTAGEYLAIILAERYDLPAANPMPPNARKPKLQHELPMTG